MNENNNKTSQDPKAGVLGAHPVAVGVGAIGAGAAAGAAGGAIAGPVGAVAGAALGAVVGGISGQAVAESINPAVETKFWQDSHSKQAYATSAFGYEQYAPAYRYGWESYRAHGGKGKTFQSVEDVLGQGWDKAKGSSTLVWDQAKDASRGAWNRVESAARGFVSPAAH